MVLASPRMPNQKIIELLENQDHLNKKGAEVLSREVMTVIENDL